MNFGTQRFGIECNVLNTSAGLHIGDLWLWADGQRIGDQTSAVDLPLVLAALSGPLFIRDRRHDVFFDSLTKEQVAEFFGKLVFTDETLADRVAKSANVFRRYLLISAPDLEGFDSVFVLLIGAGDGGDRLIWKCKGTHDVHEVKLDFFEYDICVLSCLDWVHQQTGYRSPQRTWLGLQKQERQKLRQAILLIRPELREPEQWERLDEVAAVTMEQTKEVRSDLTQDS
jgi:hypothetical protein